MPAWARPGFTATAGWGTSAAAVRRSPRVEPRSSQAAVTPMHARPDLTAPLRPEPAAAPTAGTAREVPALVERIKALRCLAAVATHGSTMRAAHAIHLSQPAVTRAILELERHVGQPLFDRGARGMVANALGARIARRAARLRDQLVLGAEEALQLVTLAVPRVPAPQRFAEVVAPASLKALLAVAAQQSESRAAELLGVSQPAIHRSLRVLEDACGAALYVKSARGTRLTDSGEALLRRVKLALAELRAMEADIAACSGQLRGRIVVGALPLSVQLILPEAVAAVMRQHGQIQITVVDGTYDSLTQQLRHADVDLMVGALRPDAPPEVQQEALFRDDLAVIARPGHPCLRDGPPTLERLLHWPWVVPLPGTPARAALQRLFADQGLPAPRDDLQATSTPFTRMIVTRTDHLALASQGQARHDERAGILAIVPIDTRCSSRTIGLALRSGGEPSPDLQALVEALREQAAEPRPADLHPSTVAHKANE